MFNVEDIIKVTAYFTKIHHTKGRLRVRVDPKVRDEIKDFSDMQSIVDKIDGIKRVKINKIVASVTIEYDPIVFEYELWEDLLAQQNLEHILERINRLSKADYLRRL
jgi:hypothetical protein